MFDFQRVIKVSCSMCFDPLYEGSLLIRLAGGALDSNDPGRWPKDQPTDPKVVPSGND